MLYGREKYEPFQDTTPYKYMLVRLILSATHDGREDTAMGRFAADALRLLSIDILFKQSNFDAIRMRMQELLMSFPPEGTPPHIPMDEPVFLLRSTDPLGPIMAKKWVESASNLGVSGCRIKSANDQATRMLEHQGRVGSKGLED